MSTDEQCGDPQEIPLDAPPITPALPPTDVSVPATAATPPRVPAYFVVVVPDASPPYVAEFMDQQSLVEFLRDTMGQDAYLFTFHGEHWAITKSPLRFLKTPTVAVPLFDVPDADSLESSDGYVGVISPAFSLHESRAASPAPMARAGRAVIPGGNYSEVADDGVSPLA